MFAEVEIPEHLPRNFEFLMKLILDLKAERERFKRQYELMERKLQELLRRLCGPRSEKLNEHQLALVFEQMLNFELPEPPEPPEPPQESEPPVRSKPRSRSGHGRGKLPKDLPRRRVVHDTECECEICGKATKIIGEEVTEKLGYEPAQLYVVEEVRIKRACEDCEEGVITAPKPPEAIPKCLATPGLLAQVLTSKYADHLPLYRQEGIFQRMGVELSRSTMCDWVMACGDRFRPVTDFMTQEILQSFAIHTDDTAVPILDPELGATRRGRLWVYIGDRQHPHIVLDYTPTRERDGPAHFLKDFSGYLQADAYAGYDGIYATGLVQEVACWAHARRYFYDLMAYDANGPQVTAMGFIKQLYRIEEHGRQMESARRQQLRQKHSLPVLRAFKKWMTEQIEKLRPKDALAKAIGYVMNQWEALNRYTEHGDLSIDNNLAERTLRPVAIGRKNWLFAGSDDGARRGAVIFSLVASCKLHHVDPYYYLRFLLEQLPIHPAERIGELTPMAWARTQAAQRQPA